MEHLNAATFPADLLPDVIKAVKSAGGLIRAEFHRPGGPRGSLHKAIVDTEAENLLRAALMSVHQVNWRGEETDDHVGAGGDTWIVDPHDGTADFMKGLRGSAVSVALVRDGTPVLGVVYAPLAPDDGGDLIAWAEGRRLTRNGEPVVQPSASNDPVIALNADAADYAAANHVAFRGARVRCLPSPAYRAALAAVGEVDVAMSLVAGLSSWDRSCGPLRVCWCSASGRLA